MVKTHHYTTTVHWQGNQGTGTSQYTGYSRQHSITAPHKSVAIGGSSDAAFRGDATLYNPEELLLASLSSCHMLWYLHLCAVAGVIVIDYKDQAEALLIEKADGGGKFQSATLYPQVTVLAAEMIDKAILLHHKAHDLCFIANSVNFSVHIQPIVTTKEKHS
jgi:organic hydroperoxide reductase OsmC/OhrA